MRKHLFIISIGLLGTCATINAQAEQTPGLIKVYHAALKNDPQYQQALANRDIAQQNLPLQTAALLPQINVTGSAQYTQITPSSSTNLNSGSSDGRNLGFDVSLTQSIFNYTNWMNVASAKASVKAAYATYTSAVQSLIQRTIKTYFDVLLAEDTLQYTAAEKRAFYRQYKQAKESYEVGVKTITDVYNAKASYDSSVADYVEAQNDLKDQKENLRAITGTYYSKLAGIKKLPLVKPSPANVDKWTHTATQHNWELKAAHYTMASEHAAIKAAFGGHLPSLSFTGSYDNTYRDTSNSSTGGRTKTLSGELDLTVPIYSGGQVTAQVKQAIAQYNLAAGEFQQTYRSTVNNTRQAYLGAISGISQVKADKQAIKSNRSSLQGMEEGYKVGTQTMTNVLIAEKDLYDAERQYANDENKYIMSLVNLKQAAGTLNIDDINKLNAYLGPNSHNKKVASPSATAFKMHSKHNDNSKPQ